MVVADGGDGEEKEKRPRHDDDKWFESISCEAQELFSLNTIFFPSISRIFMNRKLPYSNLYNNEANKDVKEEICSYWIEFNWLAKWKAGGKMRGDSRTRKKDGSW